MSSRGDSRYKALDHPIRRNILQHLSDNSQTYTQLLQKLGIESGHLAYHLRNLEGLIEKDEDGYYHLSQDGVEAHNFLIGEKQIEAPKRNFKMTVFLPLLFLVLVIFGALFSTSYNVDENRIADLKTESSSMSLQALDIVYEIFEDWEIPREHWTELLLQIVEIKSNLNDLYEYSGEEQYRGYAERLEHYESELSNVIVTGDPGYMSLTVEKRYLIRELHSLLLEIEESL
ncbi:MAG: winged helix-turn-helix domain-containing protein [Candidatus Bathyarchaeota archaeon]